MSQSSFVCTQLNSSIGTIDETLTSTRTLGQSGFGSNGNEGVLHIPQSSIRWLSVIFRTHRGVGSNPSAKMQLVYSIAPAVWATKTSQYHHHHHGMLLAPSCHSSLLSIALGRSSRLHPVSVQSCCRQVLTGCPTLAHLYEGVHRSTSLMSLSLLLQQCSAWCLVYLI